MKKALTRIFVVVLLLALALGSYFVFGNYSTGYRTGHVMKISKKGVVFKTWEGQLNVGGLQEGHGDEGVATTVWNFSVTDQSVLNNIESAVDSGKEVKLMYKEKFFQLNWRGDTKYFVYKVEPIN